MLASFLLHWEFLLHILCWLPFYLGSFIPCFVFYLGILKIPYWILFLFLFSFPPIWGVSLTHPMLDFIFIWGVSLKHPVLASFLCSKFLLHIPCWLYFSVGTFSYTHRAAFIFIWGVSLTHTVLASFLTGEFLLEIPCWHHFLSG